MTTAVLNPSTNTYGAGTVSGGLFSPSTHTEVSPRVDLQLGQKNTLTLRYQFERYSQSGSIGSPATSLPGKTSSSLEHTIQVSDSQVINEHIVNETRFQYLRDLDSSTPTSTTPTISVPGSFFERRQRWPKIQRSYRPPGTAEPDHHVGRCACHQVRYAAALQPRRQFKQFQLQWQLQLSIAGCVRCGSELHPSDRFNKQLVPQTLLGQRFAQQAELYDRRHGFCREHV